MDAFAIYRLPRESHCRLVLQYGGSAALTSIEAIGTEPGFVIAPFAVSHDRPVVVIRPDEVRQYAISDVAALDDLPLYLDHGNEPFRPASSEAYHEVFSRFHRAFSATGLQKMVLARCADVPHHGVHPVNLFIQACQTHPEAFVALFSAPECGTWLLATPEVLLARHDGRWHTMALAGTMPHDTASPQPVWSDKNVNEQAHVSRYIGQCLEQYSDDVQQQGPYTTRAGNLVHLRTDFSFILNADATLGQVIDALHPTPAVCGVPKLDSLRFIIENEALDRSYYSGFSGPVNLLDDTAMFVSLRCMRLFDDRYRLYAGGGILPQSVELMEWRETAAKMQAMLSLIN